MPEGQDPDYQADAAPFKGKGGKKRRQYRDMFRSCLFLAVEQTGNNVGASRPNNEQQNPDDHLVATATRKIAKYTGWLAITTIVNVFIAIIGLYIVYLQLSESRTDFAFIHRPHFRIRFADISHTGDEIFRTGTRVEGTIQILNNGQSAAGILDSDLEVYWSNDGLPMTFPNIPKESDLNQFVCGRRGEEGVKCSMPPGDEKKGIIHSDRRLGPEAVDIESGHGAWKIYLLGWISYSGTGDDNYVRHFDFAEIYDPIRKRFFPETDDPDYAYDPDKP